MSARNRRLRDCACAAGAAFVLAAAGCGGKPVLKRATVEQGSKDGLARVVGKVPQAVSCPSDLEAKVGASERCVLTDDHGTKFGMTVSVTRIQGTNANFNATVDNQPLGGPSPGTGTNPTGGASPGGSNGGASPGGASGGAGAGAPGSTQAPY